MNIIDNKLGVEGLGRSAFPGIESGPDKAKENDLSFKDLLKGLVNEVDSLQKDADDSIKGLMAGEDIDIHDVTIKMEEAGIAFDLMMEIRTKLLDAYQQIMKMQ